MRAIPFEHEQYELLKSSRDLLLSLHKSLVDFERSLYEGMHGPVTSGQFLNLLLENADFAWLRRFSTLIVEIDEMFAQKDGFSTERGGNASFELARLGRDEGRR